MSDIYDYAYIHVMRHPVETNRYSTAPQEQQQVENEVNSSDFSPRDLQIFVDSLETISRLEQARNERRQRRKVKKTASAKRMVTNLDASIVGCTEDDDATSLYQSSESDYIYDETYFGLSSQGQTSTTYSNITTDSLRSDATSDSEESGVFLDQTSESHVYENIDPIRPRSKNVSHAKGKSLKSRLIALIMKKQYVRPAAPSVEMLSSTTIGEETEETEIYDRVVNDVIQHQFVKNSKKGKTKYTPSKKPNQTTNAEEKFLDKAMRFLTL